MIEKLAMFLENGYVSYANVPDIVEELDAFEYEVTASNNVTYSAPSGKHDDIVLAMALAVQQMEMTPTPYREYTYIDRAIEEMQVDQRTGYFR